MNESLKRGIAALLWIIPLLYGLLLLGGFTLAMTAKKVYTLPSFYVGVFGFLAVLGVVNTSVFNAARGLRDVDTQRYKVPFQRVTAWGIGNTIGIILSLVGALLGLFVSNVPPDEPQQSALLAFTFLLSNLALIMGFGVSAVAVGNLLVWLTRLFAGSWRG